MSEQVTINFYANEEIKALLEQWAREEDRSVSNFLRRMIEREKERRQKMQAAVEMYAAEAVR